MDGFFDFLTAIFGWLSRKKPNAEDAHAIAETREEAKEMAEPSKPWRDTVGDL